jgi:hypothetical protein
MFARVVGIGVGQVAVGATVSELIGLVASTAPGRYAGQVPDTDFSWLLFPWLVPPRSETQFPAEESSSRTQARG